MAVVPQKLLRWVKSGIEISKNSPRSAGGRGDVLEALPKGFVECRLIIGIYEGCKKGIVAAFGGNGGVDHLACGEKRGDGEAGGVPPKKNSTIVGIRTIRE